MPTITISNNTGSTYTGNSGTKIKSLSATTNWIGNPLEVFKWAAGDVGNALLEFTGISSITGPVSVTSCSLTMVTTTPASGTNANYTIALHRVLRPVVLSSTTWNTYDTTNAWTEPGGRGAGDIIATASATAVVSQTTSGDTITWTSTQLASDVQDWINGVSANHGWLLTRSDIPDPSGYVGESRTFFDPTGTDGSRPTLTVTYTPVSNAITSVGVVSLTNVDSITRVFAG